MVLRRSLAVGFALAALLCATASLSPVTGGVAIMDAQAAQGRSIVPLPNREGSLKFAVLGDFGDGSSAQMQVAQQMVKLRGTFPFELVITVGDNIYGGERPQDLKRKFEVPYGPLMDERREVLRLARQPRRPRTSALRAVQHGWPHVLHLQGAEAGRAILCARDRLSRTAAGRVAAERVGERRRGLENPLLPPSALLFRRAARIASRPGGRARTAVPQSRGQRRVCRATITSTSGRSRRRASSTSSPDQAESCARTASTRAAR